MATWKTCFFVIRGDPRGFIPLFFLMIATDSRASSVCSHFGCGITASRYALPYWAR